MLGICNEYKSNNSSTTFNKGTPDSSAHLFKNLLHIFHEIGILRISYDHKIDNIKKGNAGYQRAPFQ